MKPHLERVAGYAESAYQTVSSDLKHDLAFKVPLIIFKTYVDFEQENVIPGAVREGVAAFAEPTRNRMLLPLDEPPDLLYRTITHELTHIFEFDIIPQSLIGRDDPLWINEGLSDFMTGYWTPLDLATVRDAAVADIVPKMSKMQGYGDFSNPRLVYNLGHAAFEFMESRWGKEGIRQFLFSLRKSVVGSARRRVRGGVQAEAGGVRPAVREVPEGPVQAVPRQGAADGLRPGPRAEPREDALHERADRRAVSDGRPRGGR